MKILSLINYPHIIQNSRPSFIFRTQIEIFFMKSSQTSISRNTTDPFKAQKGSKDIVKKVHVTSEV